MRFLTTRSRKSGRPPLAPRPDNEAGPPTVARALIRLRRPLVVVMLLCCSLPLPVTLLTTALPRHLAGSFASRELVNAGTAPEEVALTPASWWDRSFQEHFDAWFTSRLEPRRWIVRLVNQVYYSAFGRSHANEDKIVVGRDGWLYEVPYLRSYCGPATPPELLAPLVRRIAALAAALAHHAIPMVLVVTPSKAVVMPEFLPPDLCDPPQDKAATATTFVALAREAGLAVVDGTAMTRAAKAADPLPPFPPGGTHWSNLMGERAAGALVDAANRAAGKDFGAAEIGEPRWDAPPAKYDADLANLLNLFRAPVDYPTAAADFACRTTDAGRGTDVTAVGGSFLHMVLQPLSDCGMFRSIEIYFYYTRFRTSYADWKLDPITREAIDWRSKFRAGRLILLEINEARIDPRLPWINEFLDDALAALE